jgi:hypothetical protein
MFSPMVALLKRYGLAYSAFDAVANGPVLLNDFYMKK